MFTKLASPLQRSTAGALVVVGLAVGAVGLADAAGSFQQAPAQPEAPAQAQQAQAQQAQAQQDPTPTQDREKIVITMRGGTDDLHGSVMALKLGKALLDEGAEVTLFVNLEAVRLLDRRQPDDLRWGLDGRTIGELYRAVVDGGGKVLVCSHCAKAVGLDKDQLRKGATIPGIDEVAEAMIEADKVIDY